MPFIPHTKTETQEMLREVGVESVEELYDEIPSSLRVSHLQNLPEGLGELEVKKLITKKLKFDLPGACYIGAGAYDHHIPAAISAIISRGEYLTAYTPYQAEASQGSLQLIYEYQTMIASLMGLEASNASVYDGACALTEAILMALRVNKQSSKLILMPKTVNPAYRRVVKSILKQQGIALNEIDYDHATGKISLENLGRYEDKNIGVLIVPQPNFFGVLEEVDKLTDWAHSHNALVIGVVNPIAMSLLKEPGKWGQQGADIACGEGQPLGIPMASGGPYFGFMACKKALVRQMPGRIVGRTVDQSGKQGFTLTLQAREQHIRRAKATSNICTNQGLMVTAATVYMSLLGAEGLRQVAAASHYGANKLLVKLLDLPSVERVYPSAFFHEFVIQLNVPVSPILKLLAARGIQGGYDLSQDYPELTNSLLVCVTETKTEEDLVEYCYALARAIDEVAVLTPAL